MSRIEWHQQLRVPDSLQSQLLSYRRRVWTIKLIEALAAASLSLLTALLGVFVLDRLWDTPAWIRAGIGIAAVVGLLSVPYCLQRWVWRFRRLDQLAQLLRRKLPRLGDQLLGIIELSENRWEQTRSPALCQAAIEQAARDAQRCDFRQATPETRHKTLVAAAAALLGIVTLLAAFVPAALGNAWWRLVRPFQPTPRYTFAALAELPSEMVVAHGEPFAIEVSLREDSPWQPAEGTARLRSQPAITATRVDGKYRFELPAQIESHPLQIHVGDARHTMLIKPEVRPALTSIVGHVQLPEYLGLPEPRQQDARGGALGLVKGSRVRLAATANRPLTAASALSTGEVEHAADEPLAAPAPQQKWEYQPSGSKFSTDELLVDVPQRLAIRWVDDFGLAEKEPFQLSINALDDGPPQLACEDLPRGRVVLNTEQLVFRVHASDDFGIRQVGMTWKAAPIDGSESTAAGQTVLASGGNDRANLDVQGTFTASSLGIEPQPIEVRVYATDYYLSREPTYSAPFLLYVLSPEQHAIWITEQLAKWHRQSLEVRDKELQLYETNKELRALSAEEIDRPDNRRRIESQATAERVNGRRLANLTADGKELLRQAARNPEIGVGHLDQWAEMLQILDDIAANRMPSVADLLKTASKSPRVAAQPANTGPMAGQTRGQNSTGSNAGDNDKKLANNPAVPRIGDGESSQQPADPHEGQSNENKKEPGSPSLRLPVTTVLGNNKRNSPPDKPADETVAQAVTEQRDLLAEFEKVANQLNQILGNLEGSTLVKRLKAAARDQYNVAGKIDAVIAESFGKAPSYLTPTVATEFRGLSEQEDQAVQTVSYIMDDMAAYFERRRLAQFKTVLDDMRGQDVLGLLRQLAGDIPREQGLSISQAEYWSDVLDRWAEDLVDPACSGQCPGCRSKGSLPPSIVLEVLQILEGEINLREETRVAEQARSAVPPEKHAAEAVRLKDSQTTLADRVKRVVDRIRELPDADQEFDKEIALLNRVSTVMGDAAAILAGPDTGPAAVAAETEAIELLLQSKRINPKGGGGGGPNPGGGGTGTTQDSALALLGAGMNEKEVRENPETEQSSGQSGTVFPEEFRHGLDQYFDRLEEQVN